MRAQMPSQSRLGMALFASERMYLTKVTSDLCRLALELAKVAAPVMAAGL
jgi:hypothetical protein